MSLTCFRGQPVMVDVFPLACESFGLNLGHRLDDKHLNLYCQA